MISKVNLEKPPQYAVEGEGASAYAAVINNAVFTAPSNLSSMEDSLDNQFLDSKFGGTLDNKGKIKVRETNQITIKGRLLPTTECMELLEWGTNVYAGTKATSRVGGNSNNLLLTAVKGGVGGNSIKFIIQYSGTAGNIAVSGNTITYSAGGSGQTLAQIKTAVNAHAAASALVTAGTITGDATNKPAAGTDTFSGGTRGGKDGPRESRTWLVSYLDNADNEIYRIARGCKPMSCNVVFSKEDTLMLEIVCSCKDYYETDTPVATETGLTGTPSYAIAEPSADGLIYEDLGDFHYKPVLNQSDKTKNNTTELAFRGGNIQVTWGQRAQDSNGSIKDWYKDYGSREGSGSFEIFKEGADLNEDARTPAQYVGWIDIQYTGSGNKGSQAETIAKSTASDTNGVNLFSKLPGSAGNDITFRILAPGRSGQTQVRVNQHDIDVVPKNGGDTVTNIVAIINADKLANNLVTAEVKGSGNSNVNAAVARVTLSGGISRWRRIILERMKWIPSTEPMLGDENQPTIESKSIMADAVIAATT